VIAGTWHTVKPGAAWVFVKPTKTLVTAIACGEEGKNICWLMGISVKNVSSSNTVKRFRLSVETHIFSGKCPAV